MSVNTTFSRTLEIETYDGRYKGDIKSNSEQVAEEMKNTRFAEADDLQKEIEDIIDLHVDINERVTTSVKMRAPIIYWTNAFRIIKLFLSTLDDALQLSDRKAYHMHFGELDKFVEAIEAEIEFLKENPDSDDDRYENFRTVLPYINGKSPKASSPVEAEIDVLEETVVELKEEKKKAEELVERVEKLNRENNTRLAIRIGYEFFTNRK